eukprot:gene33756-43624_t
MADMLNKKWKNLIVKWFQRRTDKELSSISGAISNTSQELSILTPEKRSNDADEGYVSKYTVSVPEEGSNLLRVYKMGKKVVRKVPDNALLGLLALISTELLQREVFKQSSFLPPLMRTVANTTMNELDLKLDLLTYLNWDFDPFIQNELENLQLQPWEAIDRFFLSDFFTKIELDITPTLSKLNGDPKKVKEITKNIKDLVKLLAVVLAGSRSGQTLDYIEYNTTFLRRYSMVNSTAFSLALPSSTSSSIEYTTNSILANVDNVSLGVEGVIVEWNRILDNLSKLVKAETLISLFLPQYQKIRSESVRNSTGFKWTTQKSTNVSRFLEGASGTRIYYNIVEELQKNYNGSAMNFFYERMVGIIRGENLNWTSL